MPSEDKDKLHKKNSVAKAEAQNGVLAEASEPGVPPLELDDQEAAALAVKSTQDDDLDEDTAESIPASKSNDESSSVVKDDEPAEVSDSQTPDQPHVDDLVDGTVKPDSEDTPFDDEKTDQAISDIIAKEGDDILAMQDAAAAKGAVVAKPKRERFWRKKWVRVFVILLLLAGIGAALAVPTSRYPVLNAVGVRGGSSVVVLDSVTQLPLKGVEVLLGGKQVRTDSDGNAAFSDLRLGKTYLEIHQVGFEKIGQDVVIGWGSNPLGRFMLKATGVQYVIEVKDYVSGQPLEGVEATNGGVSAVSDKDGKITLTLENTAIAKSGVGLGKAGYRSENVALSEDPTKPTQATLVLARKAVFVNRQNNIYSLYKSDIDGKNREVLVTGTGRENSNIALATSQDGARAAYVSTRDGKHDAAGLMLSSLALVNVETGNTVTIAEAAQIQLIDWIGTRLVFQLGSSSASADDKYTIISYDYSNNTRVQLAAAKKFQTVLSAKGSIYYAPAANPANPSLELGMFKVAPDGKGRQRVFDTELSGVIRPAYNVLHLQGADGTWYSYDMATSAKAQMGTPGSLSGRQYVDDETRSKSAWVSQSVLRLFDVGTSTDSDLASIGGLAYPLQWAGSAAVIFRVSNAIETADYIVSTGGGTPRKIADVTPTYGFSHVQ